MTPSTRHIEPLRVGRRWVHVVCEGWAPIGLSDELPGTDVDWADERDVYPWAFATESTWQWHVHAFVVEGPEGWVAVDTGLGAFPPYAPWGPDGPAADPWGGIDRAGVGHVVHTHLHADHAGGAIVDGAPRFPNAVHHLHQADWDHYAGGDDDADYVPRRAMEPMLDSGALELGTDDGPVAPGIEVVHSPGHTPGHRSVLIRDEGDALLVTGDLLHLPTQVQHRTRPSSHDVDPELGVSSRTALLERAQAEGWRVGVPHFAEPFGTVVAGRWT